MSETLSVELDYADDAEVQLFEPRNRVPEYIDPKLDDSELFNLVAQNASEIVELDGVKMTLSEAMSYIPITKDNIHQVIATVQELLARREIETEETEDEEDREDETDEETEKEPDKAKKDDENKVKSKAQSPKEKPTKTDPELRSKTEKAIDEQAIPIRGKLEKNSVAKEISKPAAKAESIAETSIETPAYSIRSEEKTTHSKVPAEEIHADTLTPQADAITSDTPVSPEPRYISKEIDELPAYSEPSRGPELVSKVVPAEITAASIEPAETSIVGMESPHLERLSVSPLEFEEPELFIDTLEAAPDLTNESDGMIVQDALEYQMIEALDIIESEEILLNPIAEPSEIQDSYGLPISEAELKGAEIWEEISPPKLNDSCLPLDEAEAAGPESLFQPVMAIEGIEDTFIQLTEKIQTSEPETAEMVNEILDKIIEVPAKLEAQNDESTDAEVEIQEELEELFTELLDQLDIGGYAPELAETLARLILTGGFMDEIEEIKGGEIPDQPKLGSETHEIIIKLIAGLRDMKTATVQAGALGKSALRLYILSFAA